jgi:uncharacterized protein YecT (DUF1311 family)
MGGRPRAVWLCRAVSAEIRAWLIRHGVDRSQLHAIRRVMSNQASARARRCANARWRKAEAELNETYGRVLKEIRRRFGDGAGP